MPATLEPKPKALTPAPAPVPQPPIPKHRGWKRAACWLVLGALFIAVAAVIDPLDSPASERLSLEMPMPVLPAGSLAERGGSTPMSADGLDSLGSLEGLSTTVWFYAGIQGPLASLQMDGSDPTDLVALEELYRLVPELRLDTGIALMGEVPVQPDDWSMDW